MRKTIENELRVMVFESGMSIDERYFPQFVPGDNNEININTKQKSDSTLNGNSADLRFPIDK